VSLTIGTYYSSQNQELQAGNIDFTWSIVNKQISLGPNVSFSPEHLATLILRALFYLAIIPEKNMRSGGGE
jgi:hypothetical protein